MRFAKFRVPREPLDCQDDRDAFRPGCENRCRHREPFEDADHTSAAKRSGVRCRAPVRLATSDLEGGKYQRCTGRGGGKYAQDKRRPESETGDRGRSGRCQCGNTQRRKSHHGRRPFGDFESTTTERSQCRCNCWCRGGDGERDQRQNDHVFEPPAVSTSLYRCEREQSRAGV